MELRPIMYARSEAPNAMQSAAEKYEKRFEIRFDSLTCFSRDLLSNLHHPGTDITVVPDNVTIASKSDKRILQDMEVLSGVANSLSATVDQRAAYFAALKNIYIKLPTRPDGATQDEHTLFVGIEREGRILAESLGWLPSSHNLHPHAKRVPFENGLLVGLSKFPPLRDYARCFIIDGAIASGSTLITVIEKLRRGTSTFNIFSVHSTYEGLQALARYGNSQHLELKITVGHATAGMNAKFYAVDSADPAKLIVGDLGDTISDMSR
jgi:uracil phosphoribosyltransferase